MEYDYPSSGFLRNLRKPFFLVADCSSNRAQGEETCEEPPVLAQEVTRTIRTFRWAALRRRRRVRRHRRRIISPRRWDPFRAPSGLFIPRP